MCTRLYPDFIVASEVNSLMNRCARLTELEPAQWEIVLSPEGCVQRQESYRGLGIGNVMLGYGECAWSEEDYRSYFAQNSDLFSHSDNGYELYRVNCGKFCEYWQEHSQQRADDAENGALQSAIIRFCRKLLTMDTYGARVLSVVGLNG